MCGGEHEGHRDDGEGDGEHDRAAGIGGRDVLFKCGGGRGCRIGGLC